MKKLVFLVLFIAVLFGVYKYLSVNHSSNPGTVSGTTDTEAQLILFWGEGCPHCAKVEKYITDNKINDKVKIASKEVYNNKDNQLQLQQTAQKCPNIDISQGIGVPFAYIPSSNQCLVGDQPIIDYLQSQAK